MNTDLSHWQPRPFPPHEPLQGRFIRLEPLDAARHGDDLWQELQGPDPALWDYLPYGPFTERAAFDAWLAGHAASHDPQCYAVVEQTGGRALGLLAYLRITPKDGCIELGHIAFGAALQRTPGATEAVFLLEPPHEIRDIDAAVKKLARNRDLFVLRNHVPVNRPDAREPDQHPRAIRIAQPALHIVLLVQRGIDFPGRPDLVRVALQERRVDWRL